MAERVLAAVEAGVQWVQFRDHQADAERFTRAVHRLSGRLLERNPDLLISINRRLEPAVSSGLSFHTSARGPSIAGARRALSEKAHLGYSVHALDEALQAKRDGVDYLVFSPVFPTSSKPDHPGAGLMALRAVCERAAPLPVMALGGVTPEGTGDCLDTGASGVAVLSGILAAADPPQAVRAYLRALNTHPTPSASPGAN